MCTSTALLPILVALQLLQRWDSSHGGISIQRNILAAVQITVVVLPSIPENKGLFVTLLQTKDQC